MSEVIVRVAVRVTEDSETFKSHVTVGTCILDVIVNKSGDKSLIK